MLTVGVRTHTRNTHTVGDNQHSFHFVKYREVDNQMYTFADDVVPRWITSAMPLDYNTVAGADKFGNIVVCRLPTEISDEVEEDPTGGKNIGTNVRPIAASSPKCLPVPRHSFSPTASHIFGGRRLVLGPKHVSLQAPLEKLWWARDSDILPLPPPPLQKRLRPTSYLMPSLFVRSSFNIHLSMCVFSPARALHLKQGTWGYMVCQGPQQVSFGAATFHPASVHAAVHALDLLGSGQAGLMAAKALG
jgi:hypothetical protein